MLGVHKKSISERSFTVKKIYPRPSARTRSGLSAHTRPALPVSRFLPYGGRHESTMASPSRTHQLVQRFLHAASPRLAYQPDLKEVFHQCGKALLRRIAQDLGYGKSGYDLRSNKGGIAVSGEITLHADDLYIQFAQRYSDAAHDILYRACQSRQDF